MKMLRFFGVFLPLFVCVAPSFGQAPRVPWTSGKVRGTPEPPKPYIVERAFPNLTFKRPMIGTTLPGSNRLVVLEGDGKVSSFLNSDSVEKPDPFLNIRAFQTDMQESYALTFHPKFQENRFVYVMTIADSKGAKNLENGSRILRFTVGQSEPPTADPASGKVIFQWISGGHNGADIRFGPDGMLYISTGDASFAEPPDTRETGQDITDLASSILRIDVDRPDPGLAYGVPKDNPFLQIPKARGEVWAFGLRNPWRIAFDPKSGDLYAGDVGWERWEMIYRIQRGGNYGWSITEGSKQDVRPDRTQGPAPILPALVAHPHEEAASITGGEFYHGRRLPALTGTYIYGDWQMGTFWALRARGDSVEKLTEISRSSLMPTGFATAPDGELYICDYAGGGLWRLAPNPEAGKNSNFPRTLSATGLFQDTAAQIPARGVNPYELTVERWADHAKASRWIGVPEAEAVDSAKTDLGVQVAGRWVFPRNTVLAKTYTLEMERGNPASARRVETQILHFDGPQAVAYTYRWNDAQTDADLVAAGGEDAVFTVRDPSVPGGTQRQPWRFYSRAECLRCHTVWNNFTPGFNPLQLDRKTTGAPGRQLDQLAALGLAVAQPKLVDPADSAAALPLRARSYLHANCAGCHRKDGGGAVPSLLDIEVGLRESRLLGQKPVQGDLGLPEARVIAPGDPARSVLLYRMATLGRGHMPYLGSQAVDDKGLLLVRDWIASMNSDEKTLPASVRAKRSAENATLEKLRAGEAGVEGVDMLLGSASGAFSLAMALVDGTLPAALREVAIAKGSNAADLYQRDLFERFQPQSKRRVALGPNFAAESVLKLKGDGGRGKALFNALCAACHRLEGEGVDFGPELAAAAKKWSRAELLDQIVHPSKLLEPQWMMTSLTLKSGQVKAGFIQERSAKGVRLKMAGGVVEEIPSGEIVSTGAPLKVSMMPEGLLQNLSAQEAADLLEWVAAR